MARRSKKRACRVRHVVKCGPKRRRRGLRGVGSARGSAKAFEKSTLTGTRKGRRRRGLRGVGQARGSAEVFKKSTLTGHKRTTRRKGGVSGGALVPAAEFQRSIGSLSGMAGNVLSGALGKGLYRPEFTKSLARYAARPSGSSLQGLSTGVSGRARKHIGRGRAKVVWKKGKSPMEFFKSHGWSADRYPLLSIKKAGKGRYAVDREAGGLLRWRGRVNTKEAKRLAGIAGITMGDFKAAFGE